MLPRIKGACSKLQARSRATSSRWVAIGRTALAPRLCSSTNLRWALPRWWWKIFRGGPDGQDEA